MADIVSRNVPPVSMFGFTLTANGLKAGGTVPFEDWEALGDWLRHCDGALRWWLGDWLLHGEKNYGHMYAQALEATGLAYQTVANAKWVAARVEVSRRRENLSFAHHAEVAALESDEQGELLDRAEREGLTRSELRELVAGPLSVPTALEKLRAAWAEATETERRTFFDEIQKKMQ